ncbi:MAG: hypothetical protein KH755_09005 [Veillonella parvula]|nr:hypothetical protein [Veillonella parvula]
MTLNHLICNFFYNGRKVVMQKL